MSERLVLSLIGLIAAGVVSVGATFYLLAMPWPGEASAHVAHDAVEQERAGILMHEINNAVMRRLP